MKKIKLYQIIAVLMLAINCLHPQHLYTQTNIQIKNDHFKIIGLNDDFNVNYKGDIKVADDDKSIRSISSGGYIEIEKRTFGNSRRLNIYPNSEGKIIYEYEEGSKKVNFEPEGRKWMEEILPDIIRNSGIDIEGRVNRFYSKGGVKAVLNEIESIGSDFISAKYFKVLIGNLKLNENEYKQAISAVPEMVSSDFERSNIFQQSRDIYINSNSLTEAYLSAVSKISSDFEKARVLKSLRIDSFNEIQLNNYLITTNSINSDFEKSNVIKYMLSKQLLNETTFFSAVRVTDNIRSDFEKSNCFRLMLSKSPNEKVLAEIFRAVSRMSSDFEKGNILRNASDKIKPGTPSIEPLFDAINSMSSDFEHANVLKSLIRSANGDEAMYINILRSAADISSDFEKSNVLTLAASRMPRTDKVNDEYVKAAKTINSSFEFGNVMKAFHK